MNVHFLLSFFCTPKTLLVFFVYKSLRKTTAQHHKVDRESPFCRPPGGKKKKKKKVSFVFLCGRGRGGLVQFVTRESFAIIPPWFSSAHMNTGQSEFIFLSPFLRQKRPRFRPSGLLVRVLCAALHRLQMILPGPRTTPCGQTSHQPSGLRVSSHAPLLPPPPPPTLPRVWFHFVFLEMVKKANKFTQSFCSEGILTGYLQPFVFVGLFCLFLFFYRRDSTKTS